MHSPLRVLGIGGLVVAAAALGACANVIGLDGLEYDREPGASAGATGTSGGPGPTSGTLSTGSNVGSTGTDAGSSGAGGDPSSSSGGTGGDPSSSSGGTGGSIDYRFPQTSASYLDLIKYYDGAFWRFEEADGAAIAIDDGYYGFGGKNPAPSDWDGNYELGPLPGDIVYGDQGAFLDDVGVSFLGGARVTVPRQDPTPYAFEHLSDEGAFTLGFVVLTNGEAPDPPWMIASCYDPVADRGWKVRLGADLVLERYGLDENGDPAVETNTMPMDHTTGFHLVTIEKLSGTNGAIRGFVDDNQQLNDTPPVVRTMEAHTGLLVLGADPEGDGSARQLFLDDLFLIPYGLSDEQLDAQHECVLEGGSCEPP